ncbi:phage tail sheath subtilisin-like domain-containing protein [Helicobacter sp. UBA3407]|uniref:phage tail sheath family protein n=1 Tax=Helicobacter TaxID=209 RepID=UPI00261C13DB|nr:phage tail sheath subtilisin-like domain-containing protein [Helicobacter sp. UBA3407]
MANVFGVNTTRSSSAARPIQIASTTPIGAVVSIALDLQSDAELIASFEAEPLRFFGSAEEALKEFSKYEGTIHRVLDGINDQNAKCPLILSFVVITLGEAQESPESFYGEAGIKTRILEAIGRFRKAYALFGYKPNLIIAPYFSHDLDISAEMQSVAERLSAHAIIDLNCESEAEAVEKVKSYGSERVMVCDPYVKVWDTLKNAESFEPMSARVAGLIAYTDGEQEYGFSNSHSNRVLNGVSGAKRLVDFEAGQDCEADRVRGQNITTLIRYDGFRVWGNHTTSIDSVWEDFTRVRVFDRIAEAALEGLFWAIDRRADELKAAKDSVEQMLLALKGAKVLVDYEVSWNEELNTAANITAGKFYLDVQLMNTPIVKRLEINFNYTDKYADTLIKMIS